MKGDEQRVRTTLLSGEACSHQGTSRTHRFPGVGSSGGQLEPKSAPVSSWCVFSYVWRHLDIGYVQGMCDLLAPLLVILDDGESSPVPSFLQNRYIFAVLTACPLTPAPSLFPLFRSHRFQLFLRAHEENESKLSTRRGHGHSLCQHALAHPGDAESLQLLNGCEPVPQTTLTPPQPFLCVDPGF